MARNRIYQYIFITCLVFAAILSTSAAHAELKIGYIRPEYIFSQYEPYQNAMQELSELEEEEIGKLEQIQKELQADFEEYQNSEVLMSPEMQQTKQEELIKRDQMLQESYNKLYDPEQGRLAQKQRELIEPIINNINEILMRIGEEEEYDFIFDAEGPVLYANEQYDLSDVILEELNKTISTR